MTELSVEARALVERVGLADGPSAERRARVKRHLVAALATAGAGIGGVTSAATASAHAGAAGVVLGTATGKGALTLGSIAVWLAAGAGLGTVVSAPALVMKLNAAEQGALPAAPAPHVEREAEAMPHAEPPPATTPPALGVSEARSEQKPAVPAPTSAAAPSLAEEVRLLESAQRELAAGRASSALGLLDEHARRFHAGSLAEERAAARVLALCQLGRNAEAKQAASAFVVAFPRSPLLPRLSSSCALAGASDPAYTR
jgi:hypothetical protein